MTRIKHPTFGDVHDVPADAVDDWLAQGWLLVEPPTRKPSPKSPRATT